MSGAERVFIFAILTALVGCDVVLCYAVLKIAMGAC